MSLLFLIIATATPVVTVRATARIVSAARVGAKIGASDPRDAPPVARLAHDRATGATLRLVEFQ